MAQAVQWHHAIEYKRKGQMILNLGNKGCALQVWQTVREMARSAGIQFSLDANCVLLYDPAAHKHRDAHQELLWAA